MVYLFLRRGRFIKKKKKKLTSTLEPRQKAPAQTTLFVSKLIKCTISADFRSWGNTVNNLAINGYR